MKERRIIVENFISLMGVQFTNYILQLATFPFLVRSLGIDGFGLYAFILSFVQYFNVVTDYGFNLTATRSISIARDDKKQVSKIFFAVITIKAFLFIISSLVIVLLVIVVPKLRNDYLLYIVSLLSVLGNVLFPVWYYQGIEKTKYIALFNCFARLVITACIFVFIRSPRDLALAILFQTGGVVLSGVMSLVVMAKYWPVSFHLPSSAELTAALKDGLNVFVTLMAATLFTNSNIFILGLLTNNQIVGYFAVADKIARVFHSLVSPLSNAIFPHVSKLFNESRDNAIIFIRSIIRKGGVFFLGCSIALAVFSGLFVKIFTGSPSTHIRNLILILSILPLSIFFDNLYGQQVLINIGCTKEFMMAILIPGIGSLLLSFIIVPIFKDYGTAMLSLVSQLSLLFCMIYFVRRKGIYLIRDQLL